MPPRCRFYRVPAGIRAAASPRHPLPKSPPEIAFARLGEGKPLDGNVTCSLAASPGDASGAGGAARGGGELLGDPQRVILKNRLDSRALLFQRHDASHRRQRGDSTRAHRLGAQHLHFHVSPSLKILLTHRIARVMPKLSLVSLVGLNFKGCIPRGGSGPGAEGSGDPPAPIPISVSLYQGCSQSSGALISLRRGTVGMTKSSWL